MYIKIPPAISLLLTGFFLIESTAISFGQDIIRRKVDEKLERRYYMGDLVAGLGPYTGNSG